MSLDRQGGIRFVLTIGFQEVPLDQISRSPDPAVSWPENL